MKDFIDPKILFNLLKHGITQRDLRVILFDPIYNVKSNPGVNDKYSSSNAYLSATTNCSKLVKRLKKYNYIKSTRVKSKIPTKAGYYSHTITNKLILNPNKYAEVRVRIIDNPKGFVSMKVSGLILFFLRYHKELNTNLTNEFID